LLLKQIVRESVKTVLSDNKILISIYFAALLQTLKDNQEMANLIYSIPTANNGEQYEDNNNNITKYLELNKGTISHLAEKNYENLVEALTNNAINSAVTSSSSPASSLPQSSSTFPNLFNQSDTHRKEESEIHDNGKGDIAD
jgi:ABC-type phosphate/phosphonate transport system substrate-binding protein